MKPAPAFDCADCGRLIGKTRAHFLLADDRVVCIRCEASHDAAGRVANMHAPRAWVARRKGLWP